MPIGLERPKKVPIKPPITVKTRGRQAVANISSSLGSSGLKLARGPGSEVIEVKCDSQLVVNQMYGIFDAKEERMQKYLNKVQTLLARFKEWSIIHIPREENVELEALANLGSSTKMKGSESDTVVQLLHLVLDVDGYCKVNSTNYSGTRGIEFVDYLRQGKLPKDLKASRALRTKVAHYRLVDGQLYIRSYQGPLARCLGSLEVDYVMREVHEEICGNHSGADSLVLKLVRAGYYCPRPEHDAKKFIQKCDKCQRHAQLVHQPADSCIRWDHIICRFGIPKEIAFDNGTQFMGSKVTKFLEDLKIKRITSSSYHPSANGQSESTNKVIIHNLKTKLEAAKGKWPEDLPGVLWAYRTTEKLSTGEKPLSLVYGTESLIQVEVGELTLRFSPSNKEANNEAMMVRLDLLDEHRDLAHVRVVAQKQKMERYYNRRSNLRYLKVGDLVFRKVTQSTLVVNAGKLGPT
ncbi:PREDICTED: uncharacterized protein LOC109220751 [Nicotiana attenuata]|uniref:uncharacterized protein LOC109220751 n=1 Tax=Nicotiana attenuata TaxID=49451 RepID=UPI0009046ADE|nr:PREDICTED: uncharacterized protein LOC109220751 [Nicotiana attenuata]